MSIAYLYKLSNCNACINAKELLEKMNIDEIKEIEINNPLLELGVQTLFNDHAIHAPIVVFPEKGIFILNEEGTELFRIINLSTRQ